MSAGPYSIGSDRLPGLSKLIEEAGEVIQVAGKFIGSGGDTNHWDGTDLRERLQEELADLKAAIDFVIADVEPLPFVPCKGALGLFRLNADGTTPARESAQ